jgi:hypothetical protein
MPSSDARVMTARKLDRFHRELCWVVSPRLFRDLHTDVVVSPRTRAWNAHTKHLSSGTHQR